LSEIQHSSEKVNALIAEIAAASAEQSQGIGQVNQAVQQMGKVTQGNAPPPRNLPPHRKSSAARASRCARS